MSEEMKSLIIELATIIMAGGGISAFFGIGRKKKNKKLIQDTLSEIDKKQNTEIESIKSDVEEIKNITSEMSVLLKDSQFIKKLKIRTYNIYTRMVEVKDLQNSEIKNALFQGQDNLVKLADNILHNEFKLTTEQIKDSAYYLLKNINSNVNIENSHVNDQYFKELKTFLIAQIENFIYEYENFKEFTNGVRRDKLEQSIIKMLEKIITFTIDSYHLTLTKLQNGK